MYRMWYDAGNGSVHALGLATSQDGLHWDKDPRNPILLPGPGEYDSAFIFGPTILRDEFGYRMWYTGMDSSNSWTICLATSPDGIRWAKYAGNPVMVPGPDWYDGSGVADPCVILDDGVLKMWYTAYNRTTSYSIGYATSLDGIAWTKHHANPVLIPSREGADAVTVRGPCVLKTSRGYEMWYRGINVNWTICYASSHDGIAWIRVAGNPVLRGSPGDWDAKVWFPRLLLEDERYSMWYCSDTQDEIGYAYSPVAEGFALLTISALCMIIGGLEARPRDAGLSRSRQST